METIKSVFCAPAGVDGNDAKRVAGEIIIRAISDLETCRTKSAYFCRRMGISFEELYNFFNSEWFDQLIAPFDIDPSIVRKKLEIPEGGYESGKFVENRKKITIC